MTYRIDPAIVADARAELIDSGDWDADDGPYTLAYTIADREVIYTGDAWAIVETADGFQCNDADELAADCWDGTWEPINTRIWRLAYWIVHADVLRVVEDLEACDA